MSDSMSNKVDLGSHPYRDIPKEDLPIDLYPTIETLYMYYGTCDYCFGCPKYKVTYYYPYSVVIFCERCAYHILKIGEGTTLG